MDALNTKDLDTYRKKIMSLSKIMSVISRKKNISFIQNFTNHEI